MEINRRLAARLRCPICGAAMAADGRALVCANRHSYDIGRRGSVNFVTHKVTEFYKRPLFEARRRIWASGLYAPLAERMSGLLSGAVEGGALALLDAGCGEGSALRAVSERLAAQAVCVDACGVDLAADGIKLAASGAALSGESNADCLWLVQDINKLPFTEGSFDAVLNLLSPAGYAKFSRVLRPGGLLVKVLPESGYLKQLRGVLPAVKTEPATPREAITGRLAERFQNVRFERLEYERELPPDRALDLLQMTPMTANLPQTALQNAAMQLAADGGVRVTIDLTIAVCEASRATQI